MRKYSSAHLVCSRTSSFSSRISSRSWRTKSELFHFTADFVREPREFFAFVSLVAQLRLELLISFVHSLSLFVIVNPVLIDSERAVVIADRHDVVVADCRHSGLCAGFLVLDCLTDSEVCLHARILNHITDYVNHLFYILFGRPKPDAPTIRCTERRDYVSRESGRVSPGVCELHVLFTA